MIIIGEKINASIPGVNPILNERNAEGLKQLAASQVKAGATYIDVNIGTGIGSQQDEIELMQWAVTTIQEDMDTPLCIDSADPVVLDAGLSVRDGRPSMINSVKADDHNLEQVVPLAQRFGAAIVALAMDEKGIPTTADDRLAACRRIHQACEKNGVAEAQIFFDPLVLPVSADDRQGCVTLDTIRAIKSNFPKSHTVMGLSNVSYGLPARSQLNAAFLHMAVSVGLDAAIMNPMDDTLMKAVKTAEALVGKDRHFRKFTRVFRKAS